MPIEPDSTKFSFEFGYKWEGPDGTKYTFPMKYLHTDTYGPTIQIFFEDGNGVELPAEMFTEVANFLISQNVVQGALPPARLPPTTGGKPIGVPLLKRATPTAMANALQTQHPQVSHLPFVPTAAQQSPTLNPLAPPRAELGSLSIPQGEVPSLSNEEIMAARAEAKARAVASAPRMRKGHVADAYEPPPGSMQHRAVATANAIEEENAK